ncbi:MAG: metallophosphoesterase family protein [Candidatus Omnitrophota bacterium]
MKIGVISDTHIAGAKCEIDPNVFSILDGCDLIIHAGDLIDICVIECLEKIAKVEAVHGNMDTAGTKDMLPDKKVLTLENKKICIMHGHGHPKNIVHILEEEFLKEKPDIVIFGHSHMPMNEEINGVLYFNPGSATDIVFAPYRSIGIIELSKNNIKAEIKRL